MALSLTPTSKDIIMQTRLCNLHPLASHFYLVKLELIGVHIFSSPEPKAHGELIVYQSSRRPSVRPSVRASVRPHF